MPEITLSSGARFHNEAGVSILVAGLTAHVLLPHSCKTGRCSTCKCKVISGKTSPLHPESGITEAEKADGWILSCVRTADTDLILEVEDLSGAVLPSVKTLPCRIESITKFGFDVLRVYLRLPPMTEFNFIPGQHIEIIGPNSIRRSYSLASAHFSDKLLEVHIRAVERGAMSEYWFNCAKVNDLLRLNGPLGTYFLRDVTDKHLIFLVTGTGIAPVKAILETLPSLTCAKRPKAVTVLWGGRTSYDLYFDLTEILGSYRFIPVLSRPEADWSGAKGYVQDVLLALNPDLSSAAVYACGSESMINSAREALVKSGLSNQSFYSDAFVCSSTKFFK